VAVLGCGVLALVATGPPAAAASQDWLRGALQLDPALLEDPRHLPVYAARLLGGLLLPLLPMIAAALAGCFLAPLAMGGLRFSTQAFMPNLGKLNPMAGLGRMWGKDSVVEVLRSVLRLLLVGGIGFVVVYGGFSHLLATAHSTLEGAAAFGAKSALGALVAMVGAMGVLAALDVPYQHVHWRNKLKMTKQELRDEAKEQEGNPEVKARVRQVARQMSQRRMMEAVPTADVIITNPTHYAIALKYEAGKMRAPKVVAKGVDEVALRIREVAKQNRISTVEAPPLARALYRQAQLDQEIPVKLYAAVAQVLSFVYQLKHWHPSRGPMPELNQLDVGADGAPDPLPGSHGEAGA